MRSVRTTGAAGTLPYQAPECLDNEPCTTASDVYSYGIVGWEVLTGELPWNDKKSEMALLGALYKSERPRFPEQLGQSARLRPLIERCWAQDAGERPSFSEVLTTAELAEEVGTAAGDTTRFEQVLHVQQQMLEKLSLDVGRLNATVGASANMLSTLLQGEHGCPRWLVLLPKPPKKGVMSRAASWLKPKNWLNTTAVLQFICPVTRTAVGAGFEVELPRDWVVKYGPAIRVGVTILVVGAASARLAGLPVPSLAELLDVFDSVGEQVKYLQEYLGGIAEQLEEEGLGGVNEWAGGARCGSEGGMCLREWGGAKGGEAARSILSLTLRRASAAQLDEIKEDATVVERVDGLPDVVRKAVQKSYQEVGCR